MIPNQPLEISVRMGGAIREGMEDVVAEAAHSAEAAEVQTAEVRQASKRVSHDSESAAY